MTETDLSEWLSLKEASELIGVHPSTLRRWADAGTIPSTRTPGGHRRFRRVALERFMRSTEQGKVHHPDTRYETEPAQAPDVEDVDVEALMQREWHEPFVEAEVVGRMRVLGQRLLGLLIQYLTQRAEDERFLKEGREVGYDYGHESFAANIDLLDAVEAFLYFRVNFAQTASQMPATAKLTDGRESARLYQRIDRFMNEVLLGLIAAYEEAREPLPTEANVT
ncbi:MAG: helix-turn-helix domain-containing protein [Anaerolineae bacterium]